MPKANYEVLALIPARAGSASVPHKNIADVGGVPLLAHSILHARRSQLVTRIIVSTDSSHYAAIARGYGAETPFLRPSRISGHRAPDLHVFEHALRWLDRYEQYRPDIIVHLRPTCPIRPPRLIDRAIRMLLAPPAVDSVRTVTVSKQTPYKMWRTGRSGLLMPCFGWTEAEPWNAPRQSLPRVFMQNACVDVLWRSTVTSHRSMTGRRIRPLVMMPTIDVDSASDLSLADALAGGAARHHVLLVPFEGVLATVVSIGQSVDAYPIPSSIASMKRLIRAGHDVVVTSRLLRRHSDAVRLRMDALLRKWGLRVPPIVSRRGRRVFVEPTPTLELLEMMAGAKGGSHEST